MVRSLGDLAKLDEPEFSLRTEAVDAGELLDDIALRFAERAARQDVRVRSVAAAPAGNPARAELDVELFERAVANLLDNALKFCPPGSTVTLAAATGDGKVEVSVADDGPGIPSADLPQLFDRFYQSRSTVAPATADGGRGLGLAIVKRIAELHGGDVAVESTVGRGTRVVLTVPAAGRRDAQRPETVPG
jgi:signal transduction histidine kinase